MKEVERVALTFFFIRLAKKFLASQRIHKFIRTWTGEKNRLISFAGRRVSLKGLGERARIYFRPGTIYGLLTATKCPADFERF